VKKNPLVVACIPAFNEGRTIAKVVLQAQRFVNRVVVCDGGSMSMLAEMVSRKRAQNEAKFIFA